MSPEHTAEKLVIPGSLKMSGVKTGSGANGSATTRARGSSDAHTTVSTSAGYGGSVRSNVNAPCRRPGTTTARVAFFSPGHAGGRGRRGMELLLPLNSRLRGTGGAGCAPSRGPRVAHGGLNSSHEYGMADIVGIDDGDVVVDVVTRTEFEGGVEAESDALTDGEKERRADALKDSEAECDTLGDSDAE